MGLVNGVTQSLHLTVALLSFPQFLLDGLELLAQEILTLAAIHDLFGLLADLVGKLQDLNAIAQKLRDLFQTAAHVKIFQNLLALLGLKIEKVGNQIRQCPRLLHMGDSLGQFLRHLRQESEGFGGLLAQVQDAGIQLRTGSSNLLQSLDAGRQKGITRQKFAHPETAFSLGNEMVAAIPGGHITQYTGHRTHRIQVTRAGRIVAGVLLQQHGNGTFLADGLLGRSH